MLEIRSALVDPKCNEFILVREWRETHGNTGTAFTEAEIEDVSKPGTEGDHQKPGRDKEASPLSLEGLPILDFDLAFRTVRD